MTFLKTWSLFLLVLVAVSVRTTTIATNTTELDLNATGDIDVDDEGDGIALDADYEMMHNALDLDEVFEDDDDEELIAFHPDFMLEHSELRGLQRNGDFFDGGAGVTDRAYTTPGIPVGSVGLQGCTNADFCCRQCKVSC
jgi:hypothetical protein